MKPSKSFCVRMPTMDSIDPTSLLSSETEKKTYNNSNKAQQATIGLKSNSRSEIERYFAT